MKHYFSTADDIVLTRSDMEYGEQGRKVRAYFEWPGKAADSAEINLNPSMSIFHAENRLRTPPKYGLNRMGT
jgi:hypothetical protein